MKKNLKDAVFACFFGVSCAHDALLDLIPRRVRGGKFSKDRLKAAKTADVFTNDTVNIFTQITDHATNTGTFNQRYYIDSSYCADQTTCPIFMYIGGEGTLSATPGGYVATMAEEHGALVLALEHRWYGDSLPGDITSTADLGSLTVENALADLAHFMTAKASELAPPSSPSPSSSLSSDRQWLMVGGSYPGALSAWFRLKYPELATASWSSSGVILAVENFTTFDQFEAEAVGDVCGAALRGVTQAFEEAWDSDGNTSKAELLALFGTPDDFSKGDMAWMLADSAAMGPQYGSKAEMCSYLVDDLNADYGGDLLVAFAAWTNGHYGADFGASCYYSTACLSDPSRVEEWYDTKSWIWQCCHELEYWQVWSPGALRSSALDLAYFENQCEAAFGSGFPKANVAGFNQEFMGLHPDSTQVIATNGGDDPWRGCTLNDTLSESDYPETTALCGGCGHCGDLHASNGEADPPELTKQRNLIKTYLAKWITS